MRISHILALPVPLGLAEIAPRRAAVARQLQVERCQRLALLVSDESDVAIADCDSRAARLRLLLERFAAVEQALTARANLIDIEINPGGCHDRCRPRP